MSAYEKFLKALKKATPVALEPEVAEGRITSPNEETSRRAVVNVAADVYKKAIGSTVELVAQMGEIAASGTGTVVSDNG